MKRPNQARGCVISQEVSRAVARRSLLSGNNNVLVIDAGTRDELVRLRREALDAMALKMSDPPNGGSARFWKFACGRAAVSGQDEVKSAKWRIYVVRSEVGISIAFTTCRSCSSKFVWRFCRFNLAPFGARFGEGARRVGLTVQPDEPKLVELTGGCHVIVCCDCAVTSSHRSAVKAAAGCLRRI
jgi:hypothetical protein